MLNFNSEGNSAYIWIYIFQKPIINASRYQRSYWKEEDGKFQVYKLSLGSKI